MSDQTYPSTAVQPAARNFRTIALIVASAMFMEQLDATVLATALPTMARDFGVTPPSMSIALTSYLLSLAIFIPASGTMADRFGTRTVFRSAIAVFVIGSIMCAQAPNLTFLVASRLIQGLGGAMMLPVGRLVLMRSVPRKDMVAAMSWLLVPALIGPILGPPVGGMYRHLSRLALDLLHQRADRHRRLPARHDLHRRGEGAASRAASTSSASSSRASRWARFFSASKRRAEAAKGRGRSS